jgi:hypothetical protein
MNPFLRIRFSSNNCTQSKILHTHSFVKKNNPILLLYINPFFFFNPISLIFLVYLLFFLNDNSKLTNNQSVYQRSLSGARLPLFFFLSLNILVEMLHKSIIMPTTKRALFYMTSRSSRARFQCLVPWNLVSFSASRRALMRL